MALLHLPGAARVLQGHWNDGAGARSGGRGAEQESSFKPNGDKIAPELPEKRPDWTGLGRLGAQSQDPESSSFCLPALRL